MKKKFIFWTAISLIAFLMLGIIIYNLRDMPTRSFITEKPEKRTITSEVYAIGQIEPEETLKIGSIVSGIIRKLYVDENAKVTKGMLIAEVDDGQNDTEVRETKCVFEKSEAVLTYLSAFFLRQEALYKICQISQDAYELVTRSLREAKADVCQRKALYDRAKLIYDSKFIRAPEGGVIIEKNATEGETVTLSSPATIIYTIAKDLTKMKIKLAIDESYIGNIRQGDKVLLRFDSYTHKRFSGIIKEINSGADVKGNMVRYQAIVMIDNKELMFRPGMTVRATIKVKEKTDVFSVPGYVLSLDRKILKKIAQEINYYFKPLSPKERAIIKETGPLNTLWIVRDKSFLEKAVDLGVDDNAFFEIVAGVKPDEDIVADIEEVDTMQQIYAKLFKRGF